MSGIPDIKKYYDAFSRDVLLKDFYSINLRQQGIKRLCDRFITKGSNILEVGCGVGIISKYLTKKASRLVAVDISERNIAIAKKYATSPISEFKVLDIVEEAHELSPYGKFDIILLPDVIEHIPKEKHRNLFATIENLLASEGKVLITFPSPGYQEYIRKHHPDKLQIIDETIWLSDILEVSSFEPLYYNHIDIWGKNQYIHLVLTPKVNYSSTTSSKNVLVKAIAKMKNLWWRYRNWSILVSAKKML